MSLPVPDFMAHSLRRLPVPTSKNMWSTASICESSRLESVPNFEALNIKNSRWWIGSMELPYFLANQVKVLERLWLYWMQHGLKMSDAESKRGTVDWVKYSSNTISSYYFKGTKSAHTISGASEGSKKMLTLKPRPSRWRKAVRAPETSPSGPHIWNSNCCWKTIGSSPQMRYDKVTRSPWVTRWILVVVWWLKSQHAN